MTVVLSERCEQTTNLIALTVAGYRRQESALAGRRRGLGRLTKQSQADNLVASQARSQAALFRIVSLVEAHTADEIVARLAYEFPSPRSSIRSDSFEASEDSATRGWPDMKERLTKWFGLKIVDCAAWPQLMALVQVRHAVAHGSGRLTRKQERVGVAIYAAQFSALDVRLDGTRLLLGPSSVDDCRTCVLGYLEWLDVGMARYDVSSRAESC